MIEATDQPQTPAVSEFLVEEIPIEPAAATDNPEPQTPEPEAPAQDETVLTAEIAHLWQIHNEFKTALREQSQNIHSLRSELGSKLAAMKTLLAKPGRNGQWSAWLKEREISRATADRLVATYERSLNPDGNCLIAQFTEPTGEEIKALLDKVCPKLLRVLKTPSSAFRFVDLLTSSLQGLDRRVTDEGLLILKPTQQTAAFGSSAPEETHVELAVAVPQVPVEANPVS
jgi:hypothetical protein